jgi:biotin carboxyl carrier protein
MAKTSKAAVAGKKQVNSSKDSVEISVNPAGGDCGNGKVRCKSLIIDGTKYRTLLNSKYENRRSWENPDPRKIMATIPGTVLKVNVEEGQQVRAGDQMMVLEAMKMKNRIMFHSDGIVKSIHVKEGDKVAKDHLMVELE